MKAFQNAVKTIIISFFILLSACDSDNENPVSPQEFSNNTEIEFAGGINSDFKKVSPEYLTQARIVNSDNAGFLDISIDVRGIKNEITENASISFSLPLEKDNIELKPGNYLFDENKTQKKFGNVDYYLKDDSELTHTMYRFDITLLSLHITEITDEYISGEFLSDLDQIYGERLFQGQKTKEELAYSTRVTSKFKIDYTRVPVP